MRLALLLLASVGSVAAFAGEFPYQHGLVCERESGYGVDLQGTACAYPIPRAQVLVKDSSGAVTRATTNQRGEFAFPNPFPMDGRSYSISVSAHGYSGLSLDGVESGRPARSADQVQVVFTLPRPESAKASEDEPVLSCPGGVRYLLHSGVADNVCSIRDNGKYCRSSSNASAYAMANCAEGCMNTGGPGFCCQIGPGCELERLLRQVEPTEP